MRFDRLPLGEMVIGFLLAILAVTFVAAFRATEDHGAGAGVAASPTPTAQASPSPSVETPPAGNVFEIAMVPTTKFDKSELTVLANTQVTVRADNKDDSILHNWAAYTDKNAATVIVKTDICTAPCLKEAVFTTPGPGEYFFRCDVHPTIMVGKLIVQ
ncbi:MAG TPA: cupredoxin domain-containing protein [Dehalococcoidia bacterium]|nr:cupredoxin domain-containing protein [Dehalococcoidia bacterium]